MSFFLIELKYFHAIINDNLYQLKYMAQKSALFLHLRIAAIVYKQIQSNLLLC